MNVKCFKCEKPIVVVDGYRMIPVEVPYGNVFFHVDCLKEVLSEEPEIYTYLSSRYAELSPYFKGESKKK